MKSADMLKLEGLQKIEEYTLYFEHFFESLINQEIGTIHRLGMNKAGLLGKLYVELSLFVDICD